MLPLSGRDQCRDPPRASEREDDAARRLFPRAPNHKLGTLVAHLSLPNDGTYHRALADAEMTAHLWSAMVRALEERGLTRVSFEVMARLCRTSRADVDAFVVRCSG